MGVTRPQRPEDETTQPRSTPELVDLVPRDNRRLYDMRRAIDAIVDTKDWFEVQPTFGTAMICALAHLGGHPVAIVANQPQVMAGSIDAKAADKAAHFITVADSFHLPLVFLADNPGMMPGTRSEQAGVLRSGARMYAAQSMVTSPKLKVTFRKAYGFGSMVMAMAPFDGQTGTFAFPGATMGAMGARRHGLGDQCRRRPGRIAAAGRARRPPTAPPRGWASTSSSTRARPVTHSWTRSPAACGPASNRPRR